jgi:hypothetical protein
VQAGLPGVPQTANVYVPPVQAGLPGVPQRPHTQTLAHAAVASADDGASPWAVIGLALGCAALLGGAGLGLVHRARRARRPVASERTGGADRGSAPPRRGISGLRTRGHTCARGARRPTPRG